LYADSPTRTAGRYTRTPACSGIPFGPKACPQKGLKVPLFAASGSAIDENAKQFGDFSSPV
jgi:hypothetical protein